MAARRPEPVRRWSHTDLPGARLALYGRASDDHRDTKTSVTAQLDFGEKWGIQQGCVISGRFCDNDLSASHYATKERADFERLLGEVADGRHDLIWFWTLSRQQRRLDVYVQLRDLCRAKGIGWVVKKRLYDLNDAADLRALGNNAVNDEVDSIEKSENVRLGIELAAAQGRPHSAAPYGYVREYDERGRFARQVTDETVRTGAAGGPYSPAGIVREVVRAIAGGRTLTAVKRDLEARGIPSPTGRATWSRSTLRNFPLNPAYLGRRTFRAAVIERDEPYWEPLLTGEDAEAFHAAANILTDPARTTTRPGRAVHLLSYIARCDVCEGPMRAGKGKNARTYWCCAGIVADDLDDFTRRAVDRYLAREDVRAYIAAARAGDPAAAAARAEAERLRGELETYRQLAEAGKIDALDYARISGGLKAQIAEQDTRAVRAALPPGLLSMEVDWADMAVARQAVAALAEIRVRPAGHRKGVPVDERRIRWRWLLGPDAG